MNKLIQQRLNNYFSIEDKNPFNLVMLSIVSEPDGFICELYNSVLQHPTIFFLADLFSMVYLSLRNIYDLSSLSNIKYRNNKPTTNSIYGEDICILGSMSLLVETTNELLKVFSKQYPEKIDLLLYIIQTLNTIDINPFTKNNLENIKECLKNEYFVILGQLS